MNSERADDRSLGLEQRITRRDFLNGSLLASGAALLSSLAPSQILAERSQNAWDGYGGVGDYKNSHGNPWEVIQTAHQIRDGAFDNPSLPGVRDTGEVYDLVIVGGGSTGLGAAYFFQKGKETAEQRCLILENHPVFGGEAKQNEFLVMGQRLIGPQGAWRMAPEPDSASEWMKELYRDIKINQADFHYQNWDPKFKKLEFDRGFDIQVEALEAASFGYFFDQKSHGVPARWVRDFWGSNMNQSPFSSEVRHDLSECKFGKRKPRGKENLQEGELNR